MTKNAILLVVSSLLGFFFCELMFRQLPVAQKLGWNLVPPIAERLADYRSAGADKTTTTLLAIGDSFTVFRDTQNENYIRFAARDLEAQGARIRTFNLAEPGTGVDRYLNNFCAALQQRKPDIVVFGIYFGNDIRGYQHVRQTPACKIAVDPDSHTVKALLKQSLLINTAFRLLKVYVPALRSGQYEMVRDYMGQQNGLTPAEVAAGEKRIPADLVEGAKADTVNGWDVAAAIAEPEYFTRISAEPEGTFAEDIALLADDLAGANHDCAAAGIHCLFVILPVAPWVSANAQYYYERMGQTVRGLEQGEPPSLTAMISALEARQVPLLNALPALRRHADETLFIEQDTHLNIQGQEIVGTALGERLSALGWIGKTAKP